MFNKTILKFSGVFLLLSILDVLFISYVWLRCLETRSGFYCDAFEFGGVFIIFGIPALILLGLSIALLITAYFYKKEISLMFKTIFIILGVVIFGGAYVPYFLPSSNAKSYSEYNARIEKVKIEREQKKKQDCDEYKIKMSQWKEGEPMWTPPSEDCN